MDLEVIGRHLEVTPAVKEYISKKAEKLQKFFDRIHSLKAIISAEGSDHQVEFVAHLVKGDMVVAKAVTRDIYTTVDAAAEKLEHQLRRYKEKLREHRVKTEEIPEGEAADEES